MKIRCSWANGNSLYEAYHDREWGVPLHDENELFSYLTLEGAQAGLSWETVLNKRSNYRTAFARFDPKAVSLFSDKQVEALLKNPGIIRNRLKILSTVNNAKRFLEVQQEFGTFNDYQWKFVNDKPIQNNWKSLHEVPVTSPEAIAFSKDLARRGFKFVGPKIIYAHMQATGMVNDHIVECFRHDEVEKLA